MQRIACIKGAMKNSTQQECPDIEQWPHAPNTLESKKNTTATKTKREIKQ